jgi:hypothetical protein
MDVARMDLSNLTFIVNVQCGKFRGRREETLKYNCQGAQQLGFCRFTFLLEEGRRSSFRYVVILFKYRSWKE